MKARQIPLENVDRAELERLTTILNEELGEASLQTLEATGHTMKREQAVAYALENQERTVGSIDRAL